MGIRDRPKINLQPSQGLGYLVHPVLQSAGDRTYALVVIGRTEWLRNAVWSYWDYRSGVTGLTSRDELYEKLGRDRRHITRQYQVPVGVAAGESGMQAREGSAAREDIFDNGITKVSIPADFSDQSYVACNPSRLECNVFDERTSFKRQEGLIAAHARTAPSGQYEHGALHAEMITLEELAGR